MSSTVRVRFAPSPTGYLHVGGARTALYNWLFARHHNGRFILRIEDTDRTRYEPQALPDLLGGLRWLGLCWDEGPEVGGNYGPYYQSDRAHLYREYAETLVKEGRAYRCFCTPERLAVMREAQRGTGASGYDRRCRRLTGEQIAEYEAEGLPSVIRLAIPTEGQTEFDDQLRGHIVVDNRQLDDLILLKSDGFPTYHLANVIDDHLMEITHILRGDEWLSSVPKHVLLYDALGWDVPAQAYLPTILDPSGMGKLSKRKKRTTEGGELLTYVHEFRAGGYLPEAMVNFLALVGWSFDAQTEFFTRADLIELFSLDRVSVSPAAFSYDKLEHMNATYIRALGTNDLAGRLLHVLLDAGYPADFERVLRLVPLVQERLKTLQDVVPLVHFVFSDDIHYDAKQLIPKRMDRESTLRALQAADNELVSLDRFHEEAIEVALRALADRLGLKVGQLLAPIRVAVTGQSVSPPLFGSLAVLGQESAVQRLRRGVERLRGT